MLNKRCLVTIAAGAGAIAAGYIYFLWKNQRLREDVNHLVIENIHERLDNVERQVLSRYHRRKTQENLHAAIIHTNGWGYFCDTEGMKIKLGVSIKMLDADIRKDPLGKAAYEDLKKILQECISDIEESENNPTRLEAMVDNIKHLFHFRSCKLRDTKEEQEAERLDEWSYQLDDIVRKRIKRPLYPIWD